MVMVGKDPRQNFLRGGSACLYTSTDLDVHKLLVRMTVEINFFQGYTDTDIDNSDLKDLRQVELLTNTAPVKSFFS